MAESVSREGYLGAAVGYGTNATDCLLRASPARVDLQVSQKLIVYCRGGGDTARDLNAQS